MFLFLSYSFGIEMINTFIHSHSSLENHTRFQTKMGKVYTRFQTKTAQKPYPPDGAANTDTAYLWEYPPGDIHIVSEIFLSAHHSIQTR